MSVVIGEYTNTDKIRGAIGFTVSDVPDQYIVDREIGEDLMISLYSWIPDHASLYIVWDAGATEDDKHYARVFRKYATYLCAFHLCSGLELLATQAIGDSKFSAERFSSVKLDKLRNRLEGIASGLQSDLVDLLSLTSTTTQVSIFSKASPATDPVVEP